MLHTSILWIQISRTYIYIAETFKTQLFLVPNSASEKPGNNDETNAYAAIIHKNI
jgi:hypothetical protein